MRATMDDMEMEVDQHGDHGPALLLVHGLGGSRKTWASIVPLLARGARVYVPDLRGCGESTRGTKPWTLATAADDLATAMDVLGVGPCVVVGHSLGGVLTQELLSRRLPNVAGAVLISTSSRLNPKATENWRRIADVVEKRGLSDSPAAQARGFAPDFANAHPEVLEEHARITAATSPLVYAEQARAASSYDYTTALATTACPALVLQGLADQLTPPGGSVLLHRALPPTARLEMIEGAGHNLPFEMPEAVSHLILSFAQEVFPA